MQGYDPDDSDCEWEEHIGREYGRAPSRQQHVIRDPDVAAVDVNEVLRQAFGVWDEIRLTAADDAQERERVLAGQPQGSETGTVGDGREASVGNSENAEYSRGSELPFDLGDEEDFEWGDPDAMDAAAAAQAERMEEVARVPLYEGSTLSSLEAVILLLNHHRSNNHTNVAIDQNFALLHRVLLPKPNTMPDSEYAASQMLSKLGLEFNCIDVCQNNCILFRGVYSEAVICPNCGSPRRKRHGQSWVSVKILRHFPLGERLKRIFRSVLMAASMTWHARERQQDGLVRHFSQSKHMADIREKEPEFCSDPRRLFLALATDGMNPFSEKRSVYSTWPVTLMNYNLPPWMTTKRYCIILSLIIPGPKSPTGENFDTLIEPLVEELETLWHDGLMLEDAARFRGERYFLMRAMLIFCIHDFPAYGMVAGCVTKGYHGCPICGPNTVSRRSQYLKKNVYDDQARRHLPSAHPMRLNARDFRGRQELRTAAPRVTGAETLLYANQRQQWLDNGGVAGAPGDPVRETGVKRRSILFRLPYWEVRPSPSTRSCLKSDCCRSLQTLPCTFDRYFRYCKT